MSQQEQTQTLQSEERQTGAVPTPATKVPTSVAEDGSSLQVGYTEADPSGPPKEDDAPELWAGKFKTPEEMAKAYKELETKLGQREKPEQPKVDPNAPKVAAIETTEEAATMLQEKGLDIAAFTAEYETTGQLSEQSYASLEKAGITRDMVDAYIDGQRVLVDSQVARIKNSIGGEAAWSAMATWAANGLSEGEKRAYENALATNNPDIIQLAVAGVKAKYDAAMGKDPRMVVSGSASAANDGVERFENMDQVVAAMRDPRYENDPAYRQRVERKVYNATF